MKLNQMKESPKFFIPKFHNFIRDSFVQFGLKNRNCMCCFLSLEFNHFFIAVKEAE